MYAGWGLWRTRVQPPVPGRAQVALSSSKDTEPTASLGHPFQDLAIFFSHSGLVFSLQVAIRHLSTLFPWPSHSPSLRHPRGFEQSCPGVPGATRTHGRPCLRQQRLHSRCGCSRRVLPQGSCCNGCPLHTDPPANGHLNRAFRFSGSSVRPA